jgi:hypothetical protein
VEVAPQKKSDESSEANIVGGLRIRVLEAQQKREIHGLRGVGNVEGLVNLGEGGDCRGWNNARFTDRARRQCSRAAEV